MKNRLLIENLSFQYKATPHCIFQHMNYVFSSGDIVGIFGRNGSGKTTLINCLSGYYLPTEGRVTINAKTPDSSRTDIAIIPEGIDLIAYLTLEDNIKYFMEFYNLPFDTDEYREFIDKYDLVNECQKYVYEASKGTLRKIQIVIAFMMKPKLLLADEPLDGVDTRSASVFYEQLKLLSSSTGSLILFTLHDEEALKTHCNRLIYL